MLHRRHAAAKILAALALLISMATLPPAYSFGWPAYAIILVTMAAIARLPALGLLGAAAAVLPFALCFAVMIALAGDPARGVWLIIRAYLSSVTALLLVATTPMPELIAGLEWLRTPRFLAQVMQFLYRYLIVLIAEASATRQAMMLRAGSAPALRFRQAAAAAGSLFARAYARAQAIHRAMVARGFDGHLPTSAKAHFQWADAGLLATAIVLSAGVRILLR